MMTKLTDIFTYNPLETYSTKAGLSYPAGPDPLLVMGVELEIENTSEEAGGLRGFRVERDGSLRNNGWEFITLPMYYNMLSERLEKFFEINTFTENNYSERCSVHVHANCRDLTLDQIASIVLIYQAVEKLLFNFIGEDRDKNIFCVPLSETTITYRLIERIADKSYNVFRDWNKYTALNLMPLCNAEQGTIEFRHMAGTCNVDFILAWLRIISRIFAAVRNTDLDYWKTRLSGLNSNSRYQGLIVDIFQDEAPLLLTPGYEYLLEEGVLLVKYSLMSNKKVNKFIVDEAQVTNEALMATTIAPMPHQPFDVEAAISRVREAERRLNATTANPDWLFRQTTIAPTSF